MWLQQKVQEALILVITIPVVTIIASVVYACLLLIGVAERLSLLLALAVFGGLFGLIHLFSGVYIRFVHHSLYLFSWKGFGTMNHQETDQKSLPSLLSESVYSQERGHDPFPLIEVPFALLDQAALIFHRRVLLDPATRRVIVFDVDDLFSSDDIRQFADADRGRLEALRFLVRMDDADITSTLPLQDLWHDGFRFRPLIESAMPEPFHFLNTLFVDNPALESVPLLPELSSPASAFDTTSSVREATSSPIVQGTEHWLL